MSEFLEDNTLRGQPFVQDHKLSVLNNVDKQAKEIGPTIAAKALPSFMGGEGIENNADDFAIPCGGLGALDLSAGRRSAGHPT